MNLKNKRALPQGSALIAAKKFFAAIRWFFKREKPFDPTRKAPLMGFFHTIFLSEGTGLQDISADC